MYPSMCYNNYLVKVSKVNTKAALLARLRDHMHKQELAISVPLECIHVYSQVNGKIQHVPSAALLLLPYTQ